jgi:hypothetical protein
VAAFRQRMLGDSTTPSPAATTTATTAAPCLSPSLDERQRRRGDNLSPSASAATCAWTAVSNASFITIKSGATGTGNGTVV